MISGPNFNNGLRSLDRRAYPKQKVSSKRGPLLVLLRHQIQPLYNLFLLALLFNPLIQMYQLLPSHLRSISLYCPGGILC